jgi:hypothetical protein
MTDSDSLFRSSDLQLSAYLAACGFEPVRVEGSPDRRMFVFRDVPPETVAAYHADTCPVSPHKLFRSYRQLKRRLFAVA